MSDIHRFKGAHVIIRSRTPHKRHANFDAAVNEARRLVDLNPRDTFVILQEVGRVRADGKERQ